MHIPDGFLSPPVWGTFDAISLGLVIVALRRTSESLQERAVPIMGVLSAFVCAAQMLNLPIGGGTSGHFLGGALVGIVLGPWIGLTVMTIILIVQCLLFQDGGLAALGANIFNMGVLGSAASGALYYAMMRIYPRGRFWIVLSVTTFTILLSSFSCAAQLAFSSVVPWKTGALLLGGIHGLLGLAEGFVTATLIESLVRVRPDLLGLRATAEAWS